MRRLWLGLVLRLSGITQNDEQKMCLLKVQEKSHP